MNRATRITVSTLGVIMGIAGTEHGVGEMLQGNVRPEGLAILSWPESEPFSLLGGEPAMTVVPNLLTTGILAIVVSLAFIVWATVFVHQKNGGLVLILLSIAMLLVGGGFSPPILGIMIGVAGTRINAPLSWWRTHPAYGARHLLGTLWPWTLVADVIAWLAVFPGLVIAAWLFGTNNPMLASATFILTFIFSAVGFCLLAVLTGFAHDSGVQPALRLSTETVSGASGVRRQASQQV